MENKRRVLIRKGLAGKRVDGDAARTAKAIVELRQANERLRAANAIMRRQVRGTSGSAADQLRSRTRIARVYIGTDDAVAAFRVYAAIEALLTELGATKVTIISVEGGSVILGIKSWFKKVAAKREVKRVASQLVQTAEAMTVDKALAENASIQMTAIAEMVRSGAGAGSVAIDLISLQYVQIRDPDGTIRAAARALSSREIAEKRIDAELLNNPEALFEELSNDPDGIVS